MWRALLKAFSDGGEYTVEPVEPPGKCVPVLNKLVTQVGEEQGAYSMLPSGEGLEAR